MKNFTPEQFKKWKWGWNETLFEKQLQRLSQSFAQEIDRLILEELINSASNEKHDPLTVQGVDDKT